MDNMDGGGLVPVGSCRVIEGRCDLNCHKLSFLCWAPQSWVYHSPPGSLWALMDVEDQGLSCNQLKTTMEGL